MKRIRRIALIASIAGLAGSLAWAAGTPTLTAAEAISHVGETRTVCGVVASADYVEKMRDKPTFINLDKAFPKQIFTIIISGADRQKFGQPEVTYKGKKICVTGAITKFRTIAQIVVTSPDQIHVQDK